MLPKTPKEAKLLGVKHYFTGKCCPKGHIAVRFASTHACVDCAREATAEWAAKNPEKIKAQQAEYCRKNRDIRIEKVKAWREKNSQRKKEYTAEHYAKNRQRILDAGRARRAKQKDVVAARAAFKRAERNKRTPSWLSAEDKRNMRKIYAFAAEMSRAYGFEWHVDHIRPLHGKLVSGLHVPENLQVIPASANRQKSNTFNG
jgi:hypothetical protein